VTKQELLAALQNILNNFVFGMVLTRIVPDSQWSKVAKTLYVSRHETTPCLHSDLRASSATKHCHPTHLKRAFALTNARFARRVSISCWVMSARTAAAVLFPDQSDRRRIGKATISLARIRRALTSGIDRLIRQLMRRSRLQSKPYRLRNGSARK
jgi:hypothetical protein